MFDATGLKSIMGMYATMGGLALKAKAAEIFGGDGPGSTATEAVDASRSGGPGDSPSKSFFDLGNKLSKLPIGYVEAPLGEGSALGKAMAQGRFGHEDGEPSAFDRLRSAAGIETSDESAPTPAGMAACTGFAGSIGREPDTTATERENAGPEMDL